MKRLAVLFGLLLATALVLSACGGGGGGASGSGDAQRVTVKSLDSFAFDPAEVQVNVGKVTLVLDNSGQAQVHDLSIPSLNVHIVAQPGQTAEATFEVKEPGTIDFVCAQPGHEAGGMVGKLIVS